MKFRFIKEVTEPEQTYNMNMAMTGDVFEYEGYVADKAKIDRSYVLVTDEPMPEPTIAISPVKKVSKKK